MIALVRNTHAGSRQWALVWEDDFSQGALDPAKWQAIDAPGQQRELQHYAADDVYVENGTLILRSQKRSYR